jgi:hypothetical protein
MATPGAHCLDIAGGAPAATDADDDDEAAIEFGRDGLQVGLEAPMSSHRITSFVGSATGSHKAKSALLKLEVEHTQYARLSPGAHSFSCPGIGRKKMKWRDNS